MITQKTIDKINDLPILDVVEKFHETPKKSGVNYICSCPFHKDTHPSFTVSPAKGIATCFVCSKTVSNINFVMDLEQINYREAIIKIAKAFDIKVETTNEKKSREEKQISQIRESLFIANGFAADFYHNQLLELIEKHYSNQIGKRRFIERNYSCLTETEEKLYYILTRYKGSLDLIKHFKIGFAHNGYDNLYKAAKKAGFKEQILLKAGLVKRKQNGDYIDAFLFRPLIIPIFNQQNKIAGFTARKMSWDTSTGKDGKVYPKFINTSETEIYKKGNLLYGLDYESQSSIRKADKVYIVEGNTDKSSLFHIGIKNVFAKSGTALTDMQIQSSMRLTKNVCLIYDNDLAGQKALSKDGDALTYAGCNVFVITLPDKEDPDSFFKSKKQFEDYSTENEQDYIVDFCTTSLTVVNNNIQQKAIVREYIAKLVLHKNREIRPDYIKALSSKTDIKTNEWKAALRNAALQMKNEGLNSNEVSLTDNEVDNSQDNYFKHDFYYIVTDKNGDPTGISIDKRKFLARLQYTRPIEFEKDGEISIINFGFYIYDDTTKADSEEAIYVQLVAGKIKKVAIQYIKKVFFSYIRKLKPYEHSVFNNDGIEKTITVNRHQIENKVLNSVSLFTATNLALYTDKKIKILKDTFDKHYTFFENCYIISNAEGYKVFGYEDMLDGYVWEDAVLAREYHEPQNDTPGIFEQFVHDITGNEIKRGATKSQYPEQERYKSLIIAGGYLLHSFTNMERKAVILTQGRISEEDNSEGREGKTLFVKALGQNMLNRERRASKTFIYIPGKDLKNDDKHKWQDLDMNTTCVLYDDPPSWLNFEQLYNASEDAFKVEKKQKSNDYIEARICITTNRPINREGGSSRDRSCVIELDSIYSADYKPEHKYGHYFFRDWTGSLQDEWNKFSKYVVGTMLPAYFKNKCKLLEPKSKNLYRNELLQQARRFTGSIEVVFWLDTLVKGSDTNAPFFKLAESYSSSELLEKLSEDQDISDNKKIKKNFTRILRAYFDKENIKYEKDRNNKGAIFKIISGLPEAVKVNEQYIASYLQDKDVFEFAKLNDTKYLQEITQEINEMYNEQYPSYAVKQTIEKFNADMPF